MSDLILPKAYQNPILDANLEALFKRYPYERSRLELLLSQPAEDRAVAAVTLPPAPPNTPMRAIVLAGIGSPTFLADILNDPVNREDNFIVYIVENNLDFLRFCFQYANLTQIINLPKTEWLLMKTEESIKPAFFSIMQREHVAGMAFNVFLLETHIPQPPEVSAFYKKIELIYNETIQHVMHNFGRITDSLDGVRASLLNKEAILNNPGIEDLKGAFRRRPALVVGAGPSLDSELENIKKHNDKFVVIAADAALKPLLKAGIRVDYITSIERLNAYQKPFFEGLGKIETELIAFPVIQPELFSIYPGPARIVYRNYSFFSYFEKSWPKGILKCGGSTSHLAIRLADWFGCSQIFLIGIDSNYEEKDGLFRSHCSNTGYQEWGEFFPIDEFQKTRRHQGPMKALNNLGEETSTNLTYYQWIKEYTGELAEIGQRAVITNCSAKGLRIEGIPYKPLTECVKPFDDQPVVKPLRPKPVFNRTFNHKIVVQNFEAWLKLVQSGINECDTLLAQEEMDSSRFEALIYVYNFKVCVDPLFVSFVVQCCAKEYFEFENKWWALSKDWAHQKREKVQLTKERFQLFDDVIKQLLAIFRETSDV